MEPNQNSQINNDKENKKSEIYILEELFSYIIDKKNKNENNIFLQFLDDPNIINKEEFLIKFINEMINQLKLGNNIIIPFLDICPTLIKAYINSNLDEEKELKYIEVFKLLKINSFISREYLLPIYDYFSDLFYIMNEMNEGNKLLNKFNKVFELWKIFYDLDINENELKYFNTSSYCFIGGGLECQLPNKLKIINNCTLKVIIHFINYYDFNKNLIIFECNNNNIPLIIENNKVLDSINNKNKSINRMTLILKKDGIEIKLEINNKDENNKISIIKKEFKTKLDEINKFFILKNFFGQIKYIEILYSTNNKENNIINEFFRPYILNDNGYLYHNFVKDNISIKIINQNLVKDNYINYIDKNLNLCEYFGGLIPFIPFISLINGINKNNSIKNICEIERKTFMSIIFYNIFYSFLKIIKRYFDYFSNYIKKYDIFVLYLLLKIDKEIFVKKENFELKKLYDKIIEMNNNFFKGEKIIQTFFSFMINYYSINEENKNKEINIIINEEDKNLVFKNPLFIKITCQQLYRSLMKELFIYNRYWSKKEFFFENNIKYKLKYKQLSYFTQSFQRPLLYPILEFKEYLPSFSRFETDYLFSHPPEEIVNYNFDLGENIITNLLNNNPLN